MFGEFAREAACEPDDGELGHALAGAAAEERRDAGEIDDAAPALFDHQRNHRLADVARPAEVDLEIALPGLVGVFEKCALAAAIDGVV